MNKFNILFVMFILILTSLRSYSYELDLSIDDEIKKKYNTSAIEENLPALPSIDKTGTKATSQTSTENVPQTQLIPIDTSTKTGKVKNLPGQDNRIISNNFTSTKLKKGTKFVVKSNNSISDAARIGQQITFTTQSTVTQRYITIPAGTTIRATITNAHLPQLTGNGGLIEIKITGITLNGITESTDGKVLKANNKKIFFNNIKGKRKYIKNIPTYANKGKPFYRKMRNIAVKMTDNPFTGILSPIPTVLGSVVYGTTIVVSPISAVFSRGDRISIPQGAPFTLKLTEDIYF